MPPHSMVLSFIGACLLWVGWFGFNAGSALGIRSAGNKRVYQYSLCSRGRRPRLDHRRMDPQRQANGARRHLRRGSRTGRNHARIGICTAVSRTCLSDCSPDSSVRSWCSKSRAGSDMTIRSMPSAYTAPEEHSARCSPAFSRPKRLILPSGQTRPRAQSTDIGASCSTRLPEWDCLDHLRRRHAHSALPCRQDNRAPCVLGG